MRPVTVPTLPGASFPLPPPLEGLRRLAYHLHSTWPPQGRGPLGGPPRRPALHGLLPDAPGRVRPLHGRRTRPLVRPGARAATGRPDRLLLRRVRPPRVARPLLWRPRHPGRRPLQGGERHGAPFRRRRAPLSARLLPPDDRRRRPPGARVPRLRPDPPAAGSRRRAGRNDAPWGGRGTRADGAGRRLAGAGRAGAAPPPRHRHPGEP